MRLLPLDWEPDALHTERQERRTAERAVDPELLPGADADLPTASELQGLSELPAYMRHGYPARRKP